MTDREFIYNYLNRHHTVKIHTDNNFSVYDLTSKKSCFKEEFYNTLKVIFSNYKTDEIGIKMLDICRDWFNEKKSVLIGDLMDIIKSVDLSEGSATCIFRLKTTHKLEEATKYAFSFVEEIFNEYYKEQVLNEWLGNYSSRLENTKDSNDVEKINNELISELEKETEVIYQHCLNYFGDKVFGKYIDTELDVFFSELVISLGKNNWMVTWIGHGKLTEEKLLSNFKKYGDRYKPRIINKYDAWYYEAVIKASENILAKPSNPEIPVRIPFDHELTSITMSANTYSGLNSSID